MAAPIPRHEPGLEASRGPGAKRCRFSPPFAVAARDGTPCAPNQRGSHPVRSASRRLQQRNHQGVQVPHDVPRAFHAGLGEGGAMGTAPHSGQRSGLARRSYAHTGHSPAAIRRAARHAPAFDDDVEHHAEMLGVHLVDHLLGIREVPLVPPELAVPRVPS